MSNKPITEFIEKYYLHLILLLWQMLQRLCTRLKMVENDDYFIGAMSTAEMGKILADMIREDKVDIISCTGANLEEDLMNLVAHSHYERVPHYRDLTPQEEWDLLERGLNRVTDTCIPEEEAFQKIAKAYL